MIFLGIVLALVGIGLASYATNVKRDDSFVILCLIAVACLILAVLCAIQSGRAAA